ncbi:hypothetical protein FRC07_007993, partial [Ceratobasidium sp. 392]
LNTLLLDDSPLKAHLQPYNNLTLPEYTADLRARDLRRRGALEEVANFNAREEGERGVGDKGDGDAGKPTPDMGPSKQQYYKALRAAPFDKTLIAVIGVLHAVQHESSIVGWMRAGGMRPNSEEIARIAALVEEEQKGQDVEEEVEEGTSGEMAENDGVRSPSKRASSPWIEGEQGSPKRLRQDSGAMKIDAAALVVGEPEAIMPEVRDQATTSVAPPTNEGIPPQPTEQLQHPLVPIESPAATAAIDPTSIPTSTPVTTISNDRPADLPTDTTPAPHTSSDPTSTNDTTNHRSTRRGRRRNRGKPFFPASHPLSANDSYPFFTDGNPDEKLWFQDRDIYTYWVRRGLLALKECGIEPEADVEGV